MSEDKEDRDAELANTDFRNGSQDWGTHSKDGGSRVGLEDGRKSKKPKARGGGGSKNWIKKLGVNH